ncbi:MAG TPA: DNA repair protein RecN [Candidatus Limnocylindrales bacterium]
MVIVTPIGRLLDLAVSDLALIDRLHLSFEPGLNVLTGETGAGKSLLIDALGLALGARADTTLVRHGAEAARVEAVFDRLPEPLIAVRDIAASGRTSARIDDETVTVARLADTVGTLVEIHGQHDQQRLLDERRQRDLVDGFGGLAELRGRVADAVSRWRSNRAALAELAMDPHELVRRLEILEHEVEEIVGARLRVGEADEIRTRLEAAQHGEAIVRGASAAYEALAGDGRSAGEGRSGREAIAIAGREIDALARLDGRFAPAAGRLAGAEAEIADVASEIRDLAESVEHDPAALARLEERLSRIYALERRFGEDEAAVLAHADRAAGEVERLRGLDAERARRAGDDAALLGEVADAAADLSAARFTSGRNLTKAVGAVLEHLGFPPGVFEVSIGHRPAGRDEAAVEIDGDAVAFDESGADQVVFVFAPNPGEPARPLARIASGGELSRVALAIKQVLAEVDETPTLVFDEVDTGIGGRGADPIGRSLWTLARRHQVLCVTHLPQIAAHADAHFRIAKVERNGRTVTEVRRLDPEERLIELAEMLGGANPAPPGATSGGAAMASANELVARAEAWRAELLASS